MKKSQLLVELVSYDLNKGWKHKPDGDEPVVQALKAFIATRIEANDALIPYADFVTYLQSQGQAALVTEQALAGSSLSKALIHTWKVADTAAGLKPGALTAPALAPQNSNHNGNGDSLSLVVAWTPAVADAARSHNRAQSVLQLPVDVWRSAISGHLNLSALSGLARTCHFFRNAFQLNTQQGHTQLIRPLLPRLQDEHTLRERLEHLIKISDDLRDTQGRICWSGKPAMEDAKALVLACKAENPHFNLFYKSGHLKSRGLPPLYLAASRSNKKLWVWLLEELIKQLREVEKVPEAELNCIRAIAALQWSATNCEHEAIAPLFTDYPDLLFTKSPLITWNSTPLYIAASLQYTELYDLLVSQAPPEYEPVSELLWLVITGQQDTEGNYEAANSIERNPELLFRSGIDGLSPWQIACAHRDTHLMKALLDKLPEGAYKAALVQQEEVDKNDWHCSTEPFFKAYQAFIDGTPDWIIEEHWAAKENWASLNAAWLRIGDEFRRQAQHRQALYFQAYPLNPLPDFKEVRVERACVFGSGDNLFPIRPAAGPGFEFAILRSQSVDGAALPGCAIRSRGTRDDLLAQKALYAINQKEYLEIKQRLHNKVAQSEATPRLGLG